MEDKMGIKIECDICKNKVEDKKGSSHRLIAAPNPTIEEKYENIARSITMLFEYEYVCGVCCAKIQNFIDDLSVGK